LDASDISAARQAAHYLAAYRQVFGELDAADIADARQAAQYLSNITTANNVDFDAADLISGELDASDISAARQATHYLAAYRQVFGELDAADIADARQAAQTLNHILVTGGGNLNNTAFQRTAAEQEFARRFEAF
jgi:1,2-phenylacetyl-CoA epoxidase catalytic subunit